MGRLAGFAALFMTLEGKPCLIVTPRLTPPLTALGLWSYRLRLCLDWTPNLVVIPTSTSLHSGFQILHILDTTFILSSTDS